ncbi:RdgB/HAM1 family non-canonical purine NTP pyrophosphatase [Sphingomonas bacterium]|uniref:RdgB/HAM1 family non-canonical purine NTP pyrophosphatase n=1 Tax=Sphingomonas bacterium TaxID=1895847 RepID=UPI001575C6BE|nr:RdgB/HAM1 family non-canonical purine NTP pyrophosphatase [Sphingomonas bacterium]
MSLELPGPQAVRKLSPGRLVIASHNAGKVREITALLGPYGVEPVSAAALDLPEPEETGTTFVANAELKARAAADLSGLPALADDSGLCVDALGGDPGIFSARWAPDKDFGAAMARINALVGDQSRDAHFICVLALAWPDGHVEWFEGRADGTLAPEPRGSNGFGYDPLFLPNGGDRTYGELTPDEKHADNHRARAFAKLVATVF